MTATDDRITRIENIVIDVHAGVARVEEQVKGLIKTSDDREGRIRQLERMWWRAVGALLGIQAVAIVVWTVFLKG